MKKLVIVSALWCVNRVCYRCLMCISVDMELLIICQQLFLSASAGGWSSNSFCCPENPRVFFYPSLLAVPPPPPPPPLLSRSLSPAVYCFAHWHKFSFSVSLGGSLSCFSTKCKHHIQSATKAFPKICFVLIAYFI